jgi:hypothetical protein
MEPSVLRSRNIAAAAFVVPAGRAGSVVLWDLRSQEAVGAISPSLLGKPANTPCIGVQLDDWKLVTGWAGTSGASSSNGGSCWWRSNTDIAAAAAAAEAPARHTLELYDIRAAASFGGCGDVSAAAAGGSSSSRGMWGGEPLMSLAVPNRVTCFQVRRRDVGVAEFTPFLHPDDKHVRAPLLTALISAHRRNACFLCHVHRGMYGLN